MSELSRRQFLKAAGVGAVGAAIVACQPQTVIVKETVEVEKEKVVTEVVEVEKEVTKIVEGTPVVEKVVETQVVEKVVTPTAMPAIVTPQGKELALDAAPLEKQVWLDAGQENKHLDVVRDIYSANQPLNRAFEPILRRNEMMEIVPALAESYEPSADGSYFDFWVRKGAKWDDGVPITAHDFEFTFQHLCDPALDTPWVWFYYDIKGVRQRKAGEIEADEVGCEALDDTTFRIYGEGGPAPHLPQLLAYQASGPCPKHLAEPDPEHWADDIDTFVSCGQYSMVRWDHNELMEFVINQYYNGIHKPGIQRIWAPIGGQGFEAFLAKEYDQLTLDLPSLRFMRRDPELNALLHWFNNFQVEYLALDTMNAPLDNETLRQALSHAIDRDALVDVMGGMVQPAYTLIMPGFPGYNEDLTGIQNYDVELAKEMLAEAGYPEGKDANGNQLELTLTHSGRDPKMEFVQAQWQENLGIKVNYELVDGATWGKRRAEHAMQIYKGPYEYDYMDPINFHRLFRSTSDEGSPRHAWKNDEYDALVDKAANTVDFEERFATFKEAERILVESCAAIFLTHALIYQAWYPYFTGIPKDVTGREVFRYLDITRFQVYIRDDVDEWRSSGWLERLGDPAPLVHPYEG